jgi:outer membrane protein assembly factor BamB
MRGAGQSPRSASGILALVPTARLRRCLSAMLVMCLFLPASAVAWKTTIEAAPREGEDGVSDLVVTENGNVVVAGALAVSGGDGFIAEFDSLTGNAVWQRQIPNETGARYSGILDLELAPDGDLVIAGALGDFPVRKLSPTGGDRWSAPVPVNIVDYGGGILVDGAGNVIVHGGDIRSLRYPLRDALVAKLDGNTGAALWTHIFQEAGTSTAIQASLAPNGDVIVAGSIHDETVACPSFAIFRLSGEDGSELWRRVIQGPIACGGEASLVAVDAAGDVMAAGFVSNAYTDFFVLKASGSDGSEIWRYHVPQGANGDAGGALGLALTAGGDVVVSGRIRFSPSIGRSLVVVRLRGSDGSAVWSRDLRGNNPIAANGQTYAGESLVAIGSDDEVFIGDSLNNVDTDLDLAVLRFNGATGAEEWRFTFDGGAWGGETARGVALDGQGGIFAIGSTQSVPYRHGFTVFKGDAVTGIDPEPMQFILLPEAGTLVGITAGIALLAGLKKSRTREGNVDVRP